MGNHLLEKPSTTDANAYLEAQNGRRKFWHKKLLKPVGHPLKTPVVCLISGILNGQLTFPSIKPTSSQQNKGTHFAHNLHYYNLNQGSFKIDKKTLCQIPKLPMFFNQICETLFLKEKISSLPLIERIKQKCTRLLVLHKIREKKFEMSQCGIFQHHWAQTKLVLI